MSKKYDVVAVVGEYTDKQGQQKKRYLNVGAVMSNDNGHYLLLNKTFNPAGLAEQGRESIILSLFEPRQQGQQAPQQSQQAVPPATDGFEDQKIPFASPYKRREYLL